LRRDGDNGSSDHPLRPSSDNLEYLLEDEQEPRGGGGKLILFLIAVMLAAGFGYLHWKRGGFDWLTAVDKKPSAVVQPAPDSAQNSAPAPQPAAPAPDAVTPPVGNSAASAPPVADAKPANPADSGAVPPTSAPPAQAAPASTPTTAPASTPTTAPVTTTDSGAQQSKQQTSEPASDSATSNPKPQSAQEEPPAAEPAVPRNTVTPKPLPVKPTPAKAYDPVTEAQRYIYGRGVRQDCDHGLRLLKSSADQSNPKAMISLGALYSTGSCTPRDLPTAYRWFALALHKQPDNQALQDDLQKLWSQMTQPERQLAIKLSQ
jgi:hypothetical protein